MNNEQKEDTCKCSRGEKGKGIEREKRKEEMKKGRTGEMERAGQIKGKEKDWKGKGDGTK